MAPATPQGSADPAPAVVEDDALILVVCRANIARSPLAALLLEEHARDRGLGDQVRVISAGVNAAPGRPAADGSRRIAERWGCSLADHRSRPLDAEQVSRAALVVTMTERQRSVVTRLQAGSAPRTFTLIELARLLDGAVIAPAGSDARAARRFDREAWVGGASTERVRAVVEAAHGHRPLLDGPDEPEDVPDPFGGSEEGYVELANTLVALTETVAEGLFGPPAG